MSDTKNPFSGQPEKKAAVKKPEKRIKFGASTGNMFGSSRLDVPERFLKEAEEMGCECRWVSSKEMKENHGEHPNGWVVYKFKSAPEDGILDPSRFAYGAGDSEGVVRRQDMVLAVRPVALGDAHRQQLSDRRKIYNRFGASKRKDYKDWLRSQTKDAKVLDGYDED